MDNVFERNNVTEYEEADMTPVNSLTPAVSRFINSGIPYDPSAEPMPSASVEHMPGAGLSRSDVQSIAQGTIKNQIKEMEELKKVFNI